MVELEPGDALHIPSMWYHHVEGLEPFNMLVNYWWREHAGLARPAAGRAQPRDPRDPRPAAGPEGASGATCSTIMCSMPTTASPRISREAGAASSPR
jgi:hypothetical protein